MHNYIGCESCPYVKIIRKNDETIFMSKKGCIYHTGKSVNLPEHVQQNCKYMIDKILNTTRFEITDSHLNLLQNQNVKFNAHREYGATEIDPKRPYGNSDVPDDIGEILDIEKKGSYEDGEPCYSDEQESEFYKIHVETAVALKI